MTVDAALARHPAVRWVFAAYHIGGCDGCSAASNETLAEVAEGYGLDLERLLADLNGLR
jgi:hybrid cluster-associated redox disulfide protein